MGIHGHPGRFSDDLELIDGGGTVDVARDKQRAAAQSGFTIIPELGGMGGFPGALKAAQQDHGRRLGGQIELDLALTHQAAELLMHDLDDLLSRGQARGDFLAHGPGAHAFHKGLDDLEVDVGPQKGELDFAQNLVDIGLGQLAAALEAAKDIG